MLFHEKNGTLSLENTQMDYIRFGTGGRKLVILPGLGDGLQTVKGTALPMAIMYRIFAGDFTVYALSRKSPLRAGCTTRDMAADLVLAMDRLGIEKADILGVSMGGMIAQWLAIDHPEKVNRLILTVTCAAPNPVIREAVENWIALAESGNHAAFMESNLRYIYSDTYYRKNRWTIPLLGAVTKPESYDRFFIQAKACLSHDALEALPRIQAKTLVIGGGKDLCVGPEASRIIAARIPGAQLRIYENRGHGLYEEEKGFNRVVLEFLT